MSEKPAMVISIGIGEELPEDDLYEDLMEVEPEDTGRMKHGGMTRSKDRDGCAIKGKTKGRMV